MKHLALWIGILSNVMLFSERACAETLLKGQVTLREKRGKAVEHAQISATKGKANPQPTNSDGLFELTFLDKQPGENVEFACVKSGFEVANKLDLEQRLSAHPDDDMARIVVCPSAEFMPCATAYYETVFGNIIEQSRKAEREKIEQEYDEELRDAEERLKDKDELVKAKQELLNVQNARIAELEKQNEGLQAQSTEWAKQFAEYDPTVESNDVYKEALRLFQENKLDDADALLDEVNIEKRRQEKVKQAFLEEAKEYMLKAKIKIAKFDFANAEIYYQKAIDADPENLDNLHEFAVYLQNQNQFLKARPLYEKAMKLAKGEIEKVAILGNLGVLYNDQNEYDKAADAFNRALTIYEALAAANPTAYRPYIAMTLNNLGLLYEDLNDYANAAAAYERALAIREDLAATNPTAYRADLAGTLNNLGNLYQNQNDYAKAADAYERARAIYEELAAANPTAYRPYVGLTLNNLGSLYLKQNDYAKAADAYKRTLNIYEDLAAENPQAYRPDLASTLNNLGSLYRNQNDYAKAADAYERALKIYEDLAAANPQTYRPDVAMTL